MSARTLLIPLLFVASAAVAAQQQPSRYGAVDRSEKLQELVDQLRGLVDEADRARAADRRFLSDLRDLVRRYDWPWNRRVFFDDFRDGDYVNAPAWQLVDGGFRVQRELGLHTLDRPVEQRQAPQQRSSEDSGRELAISILGSLLEPKQDRGSGSTAEPAQTAARGTLQLNAEIPNGFALELDLRAVGQRGEIEFLVFTAGESSEGYRLTYAPGGSPALEVRRFTGRGTSVIAAHYDALNIHDGAFHRLVWTRHPSGDMQVEIDKRALVSTADRTIGKAFAAFQVRYTGGDFAIREVGLWGAN